ncbi:hypothetical protein BZG36_02758 [Bifiguratus adelaidae]|uniref:O-methyltransferase domain-containing protein n=1 Tax=Bifiguratus adelaidae TaxID=1938954 RepID=A0A261Y1V9_9FUNG|nr:hypothetical protein BZG36_02758 [Bifiguratus adelaidae]
MFSSSPHHIALLSNVKELYTGVDEYTADTFGLEDPVFADIQQHCEKQGLPDISVTAAQGKWLQMMVRCLKAQSVLEVGTLGGYSGVWIAKAFEGMRAAVNKPVLTTLEVNEHHAQVAQQNFERAEVADLVHIRLGAGVESMQSLMAESRQFDLIFVDADKESNADYVKLGLQLVPVGGTIIVDNVVRHGQVLETSSSDTRVQGVRRMNTLLKTLVNEGKIEGTTLQTLGAKGWDGMTMIRRLT